ncbi:MAG: lipopolysaccharide assembly protein LapB [Gammaproteobacteria bacterium]|nr:lipopolysaccharide assembly protein LapB [Gammaproteobacteria bacterium]MBU2479120.1 lipopolysaccharide assembly protein LapB [Gammaproteobacteria bacterium]
MYDFLWLLLPVAAASGWIAAKRSLKKSQQSRSRDFSSDYFQGLNFLLNEQPDKAIEVFIRMLEVDSDTVETHLALGNLFRRRGEVDRAIRIHQNLIARPTLSKMQRSAALLELGQDYMRAGWLDRAESLFDELLENNLHSVPALRHLLDIYQQEKEWDKAITVARRLDNESGQSMKPMIAQFHCEQAEAALKKGDENIAGQLLKRALGFDKRCVRASLLQGRMAMRADNCKVALKAFRQVEEQDIEYLPEILDQVQQCYLKLDSVESFKEYLRGIIGRYSGATPVLMLADLLSSTQGDVVAAEFVTEQVRKRPSIRGLGRLIDLNLRNSTGKGKEDLQILRDLVQQLLSNKPVYKCSHCGFAGKSLHWQCPGCKEWNTVKPIHGIEGE